MKQKEPVRVGWIDSHCHLHYDELGDTSVAEAQQAGVSHMVCIGTDLTHSASAIEVARRHRGSVFATSGLHPHDAAQQGHLFDEIAALGRLPEVIGIGECGLDYFYEHSDRESQREMFVRHIDLAAELNKTLVIHTRDAWDDTFELLASRPALPRIVFHCFTGGPVELERCLEVDAYVSFSGIVTFKRSVENREAALACPLDRMLIETDSPYLAPEPFRGRPNRPALVSVVGEYIADLRKLEKSSLRVQLSANFELAFCLQL